MSAQYCSFKIHTLHLQLTPDHAGDHNQRRHNKERNTPCKMKLIFLNRIKIIVQIFFINIHSKISLILKFRRCQKRFDRFQMWR